MAAHTDSEYVVKRARHVSGRQKRVEGVSHEWTTIHSGSEYVVKRARHLSLALLLGSSGDLWEEFRGEHERHGRHVVILKVGAHHVLDDVRNGSILLQDYLGKLVADRMAAYFNTHAQVPVTDIAGYDSGRAVHRKVPRRISAAMIGVVDMYRERERHARDAKGPNGSQGADMALGLKDDAENSNGSKVAC